MQPDLKKKKNDIPVLELEDRDEMIGCMQWLNEEMGLINKRMRGVEAAVKATKKYDNDKAVPLKFRHAKWFDAYLSRFGGHRRADVGMLRMAAAFELSKFRAARKLMLLSAQTVEAHGKAKGWID